MWEEKEGCSVQPLAQLATSLFSAGGWAGIWLFMPYPCSCAHHESTSQQKATSLTITEWSLSSITFRANASTQSVVGKDLQETDWKTMGFRVTEEASSLQTPPSQAEAHSVTRLPPECGKSCASTSMPPPFPEESCTGHLASCKVPDSRRLGTVGKLPEIKSSVLYEHKLLWIFLLVNFPCA